MAFSQKERQQVLGVLIFAAIAVGAVFWMYWRGPKVTELADITLERDTLTTQVNTAKRALRRGTVEALRAEIATYEVSLSIMRQLVPTENEVPTLVDDIASRARVRGVDLAAFERQPTQQEGMFTAFRYNLTVTGYYDPIAAFLTDVASLDRIMVPTNVSLGPAPGEDQRQFGDTSGALLQATFQVRSFVKPGGGGTQSEQ
jgi:type IV pilus assembly protein PilO